MDGEGHLDARGAARMMDVSGKPSTRRTAEASGRITLGSGAAAAVIDGSVAKGDVLAVARIGAIQAAKRTWESIPMCHPVRIGGVEVDLLPDDRGVTAVCRVTGTDSTGFEMEALSGVTAALLIVYDMTKSIDRGMVISDVRLISKSGGASGEYEWQG
jgi:cyclic pyranopterin phosphate synthase